MLLLPLCGIDSTTKCAPALPPSPPLIPLLSSSLPIIPQVNFTPSSVRSYSCALVVDVEEAGREVFSLPISAKAVVPSVSLLTPLLDFGRCFIRHPYVQNVELLNNSNLPVKYKMPPQDQAATVGQMTFETQRNSWTSTQ